MAGDWHALGDLEDLRPGGMKVFKQGRHQLVLGRSADGRVFALDNRCPHEGYPLSTGTLKERTLTCCWHNWKFDVTDGACLVGGEGVRRFDVRKDDDAFEVDLADPDPAALVPALLRSLAQGLFDHDTGRAVRDAVRLLAAGRDSWLLLADIARYDALHAEYGTSHTLALAADCGRFLKADGPADVRFVAPVIELCGDENYRLPGRKRLDPVEVAADAFPDDLAQAIEAEEAGRAEALVRGAFASGLGRPAVEVALAGAMTRHFTSFGHHLIYLVKANELLDHLDHLDSEAEGSAAADLLGALAFGTTFGTREDTLPYLRPYFARLAKVDGRLSRRPTTDSDSAQGSFDPVQARDAILDGTVDEAFAAVQGSLESGVAPAHVATMLVGAAAHRLLRFDVDVEANPDVAENWLWASHRLTFASAVRDAIERFSCADSWRFLFHALAFVHSGGAMDMDPDRRVSTAPAAGDVNGVLDAIHRKDAAAAVALAAGVLAEGGGDSDSFAALQSALEHASLDSELVLPIFSAHMVKTVLAAVRETGRMDQHPDRDIPLLAAVRFLASPVQERRLPQHVHTALRFVVEGTVPRKLTQ